MEQLALGQRIGNYSVEFMRAGGTEWEVLVPPVQKKRDEEEEAKDEKKDYADDVVAEEVGDRPDGHDPRDQYVGHKRIDVPVVRTSGPGAVEIARVRFNCIQLIERPELPAGSQVHLRQFSPTRRVPWE